MKKKRKHNLWSKHYTDNACIRYHKWSHKPIIQQRIFKDHIEIPLRNLTYSILWKQLTFKTTSKTHPLGKKVQYLWETMNTDKRGMEFLTDDVVGFFFIDVLPKWENKETQPENGFSYVYRSVYTYLVKKGKDHSKRKKDLTIDENNDGDDLTFYRQTPQNEPIQLVRTPNSDLSNEEVEYMNLVINYWDTHIDNVWRSELKKEIAGNIVKIFERAGTIKHHKQKSIYRYLRVMMGWNKNPKELENTYKKRAFKQVMSTFRKKHNLFRTQYRSSGHIDLFN